MTGMFRSFRARIFWAILLVAAVAAGLSLWLTREWLEERQLDEARTGLLREARVAGELMLRGENDLAALTRVLDLPDLRLSLLDADGRVLAETGGVSPEGMDNHGDRPEVVQARSGGKAIPCVPAAPCTGILPMRPAACLTGAFCAWPCRWTA